MIDGAKAFGVMLLLSCGIIVVMAIMGQWQIMFYAFCGLLVALYMILVMYNRLEQGRPEAFVRDMFRSVFVSDAKRRRAAKQRRRQARVD